VPDLKPVVGSQVPSEDGSPYPEPFASKATSTAFRQLAAHFGLSQFGVNLITLDPGAQSGLRHWHSLEDEFLYVLEGEITLRMNNGEFKLSRGMCMGFKAGDADAHVVDNRSGVVAHYLIIGSRVPGDNSFYPDDDLAWFDPGNGAIAVHKDGTPYP
jgi:uncharacterized cupin superfamily protein